MLHVALLWHMHQPYYVDAAPTDGGSPTALMPWVRLHAVNGYLDMVSQVERFPDLRCTFNVTPVLIRQILELNDGAIADTWEQWSLKPADALTPQEKNNILANFFSAHPEHMIRRYPRYAELLQRRGERVLESELPRVATRFSAADMRDLQVWFNLAWCGYTAVEMFPELSALRRKGRDFTEDDKQLVLQRHRDILRLLLGRYRALEDEGRVELTTTPFFHPILPLVMDTDFARRNLPRAPLPARFAHPEDALAQLHLARELHEKVFGKPPRGLWPSEGSVCPELVPLLREVGFEWFATDEQILFKTLTGEDGARAVELPLFHPSLVEYAPSGAEPSQIAAFFRDRGISDFIGFVASRNTAGQAVDFIIGNLHRIADAARDDDALVTIALDGENAWEHFPDGGRDFLKRLYGALTSDARLRTTTFSNYLASHPPRQTLRQLHTGSWINADFDIWIGSDEENRAWDLLNQTRRAVQQRSERGTLSAEDTQAALDAIYAAEGSDWFWWFGEDFSSGNKAQFDALFRSHLRRAYLKAGLTPPMTLHTPVRGATETGTLEIPRDLIEPVLDGRVTSFFEWYQAGRFESQKAQSAMHRGDRLARDFYFGFSMETLFFRLDFARKPSADENLSVRFVLEKDGTTGSESFCVVVPHLNATDAINAVVWRGSRNALLSPLHPSEARYALRDILELEMPFKSFGVKPGETIRFCLQILRDDLETECYPVIGLLPLTLPDENFEMRNWRV